MPYSMTGYGIGETHYKETVIKCEIKSINNRYLDIHVKIPKKISLLEEKIKDILRKKLSRGRIDISISTNGENNIAPLIRINKTNAFFFYNLLKDLKNDLKIKEAITLKDMLNFSEIFELPDEEEIDEKFSEEIINAVELASDDLLASRKQEGENLVDDFRKRLNLLDEYIENIEKIAENRSSVEFDKLKERVSSIINNKYSVEENRLEMEIALIAERLDISEECTRFKSHLKLFYEEIESDEPIGRKLEFIMQEMNREVNTMASKSLNFEISKYVIDIKDELEKLREQAKNLV